MTNLSGANLNNGAAVGPQGECRESPSRFPRYPAYKDSGVEWMGEVPAHWNVAPVGMYYEIRNGFPFSADNFSPEGAPEHRLIRIRDILGNDSPLYTDESCPVQCIVENGDILIGMDGDFNIASWAEGKAKLNQRVCAIRGSSFSWDRFFFYGIGAPLKIINDLTFATTVKHLASSQVLKTRFPIPPETEVDNIARFLEHETARIDALIEKKTRFIDLLREKRQALITHAVTKGLDPTVKMKDSGVEWLGEVPEHWEMVPLKYVTPSLTVGIVVNPSDYVADEGLPFLYGGDIGEGVIFAESARRISPEHSQRNAKTRLNAGDLVTVRVGAPGVTAVVPPECEGGNCASVMLIRRGEFNSDWLCYTMNSRVVRYQVEVVQYGAAQEQFNISHAVDFLIPVPPVEEQSQIASVLNQEGRRVDALLSKTECSIELLKERRSALITAAVTGQIDLREAV